MGEVGLFRIVGISRLLCINLQIKNYLWDNNNFGLRASDFRQFLNNENRYSSRR